MNIVDFLKAHPRSSPSSRVPMRSKQTAEAEEVLPYLQHHAAILRIRLAWSVTDDLAILGHAFRSGLETHENDQLGKRPARVEAGLARGSCWKRRTAQPRSSEERPF